MYFSETDGVRHIWQEEQESGTNKMAVKRQANFELMRIAAMLMIISLHYLVKGGAAVSFPFSAKENPVGVLAWLIEAFCIVAVNCYVLLSGYFLKEAGWKPGRVWSLLCQVLFYSLLIPVFLLMTGVVPAGALGVYDWLGFAFPFGTEHYWFATAYLVMYLFAPFLTAGCVTGVLFAGKDYSSAAAGDGSLWL